MLNKKSDQLSELRDKSSSKVAKHACVFDVHDYLLIQWLKKNEKKNVYIFGGGFWNEN
jgi:hypothetical protein